MPAPKAQTAYNQAKAAANRAKVKARNVDRNIEALKVLYPLTNADEPLVADLAKIKADVDAATALLQAAEGHSAAVAERHIRANPDRVRPGHGWTVRSGS